MKKVTAKKCSASKNKGKEQTYPYTITLSGDYVDVCRTEYKDKDGLNDCLTCARNWDLAGGDTVHGFVVDDKAGIDVHVKVSDGKGNIVFETDVGEAGVGDENATLRIESKGNYFDESEEATRGKKFYYSSDDWYSGWEWKAEVRLDAPFDPGKLALFCHFYVTKSGYKCKFIGLRSARYGRRLIAKNATSIDEGPTGGDDEMFAWTLVNGVRKGLEIYSDTDRNF